MNCRFKVGSYSHSICMEFRTHDLSLAATLLYEQCFLVDLDRSHLQAEFIFEDTEKLREIVANYWRDQLPYPAQDLFASLKKAKHILYDGHK